MTTNTKIISDNQSEFISSFNEEEENFDDDDDFYDEEYVVYQEFETFFTFHF